MNTDQTNNDPLAPIYTHDPGQGQEAKSIGTLTRKTNVMLLVVLALVLLCALYFFGALSNGPENETEVPAAMEIR